MDSAISAQERHLAFIAEVITVGYKLSTGNIVHNLRVFSKSRALSLFIVKMNSLVTVNTLSQLCFVLFSYCMLVIIVLYLSTIPNNTIILSNGPCLFSPTNL